MVLFGKRLNSMVAAVFGLALCAHGAQAPQHVNINQLTTTVEDVVVPLPNEIFGALNKLAAVNWKEHVRSDEEPNFTERPRIALLLGTVIADGFIAVQAEDAPAVKDIGQRVLALAKGIGVGNSITPHAKAIIDAADKRNSANVRQELDRTQNSVQQAMNEVHDEKLSQLVSLGGWLRGTEVLTSVVTKHFSTDGAELLHQRHDVLDLVDGRNRHPDPHDQTVMRCPEVCAPRRRARACRVAPLRGGRNAPRRCRSRSRCCHSRAACR